MTDLEYLIQNSKTFLNAFKDRWIKYLGPDFETPLKERELWYENIKKAPFDVNGKAHAVCQLRKNTFLEGIYKLMSVRGVLIDDRAIAEEVLAYFNWDYLRESLGTDYRHMKLLRGKAAANADFYSFFNRWEGKLDELGALIGDGKTHPAVLNKAAQDYYKFKKEIGETLGRLAEEGE